MTTLPPSPLAPVPPAHTPLPAEDQARIAEHVNEDHLPELLLCARAFTPHARPRAAEVQAVYAEGFDLRVQDAAGDWHTEFVPYPETAGAHLGIRAAVRAAQERLGTPRARPLDATLRVREVGDASRHMRRLTLEVAPEDRAAWPHWQPGFSLLFTLGTPGETGVGAEVERYYTVRAQDLAAGTVTADVYCHGDAPGSTWARGLGAGDRVRVRGGRPERFPEFGAGALLLGDETALPTVAALLEGWAGEQGPARAAGATRRRRAALPRRGGPARRHTPELAARPRDPGQLPAAGGPGPGKGAGQRVGRPGSGRRPHPARRRARRPRGGARRECGHGLLARPGLSVPPGLSLT